MPHFLKALFPPMHSLEQDTDDFSSSTWCPTKTGKEKKEKKGPRVQSAGETRQT